MVGWSPAITHIGKHVLYIKFTPWALSSGAYMICIDSIISPKYVDSVIESGSKSQENTYFPTNDRFFCNDTPNDASCVHVSNG